MDRWTTFLLRSTDHVITVSIQDWPSTLHLILMLSLLSLLFWFHLRSGGTGHFVTPGKNNQPPIANRWIPFLNLIFLYMPYTERIMAFSRKKYGDIYTIQIRKIKLHVVLDPSSGAQIFREHRTFAFSSIIDHAEMLLFGLPANQAADPVLRKETLASLNQHILSQNSVDILMGNFGVHLRNILSRRLNELNVDGKLSTEGVVVDMSTFITQILFECTGKTLFGNTWPTDDNLMNDVIIFDHYFPMFVKGYPYMFQRKGILARERILQRIVEILEQPLVQPSEYVANRKEVWGFSKNKILTASCIFKMDITCVRRQEGCFFYVSQFMYYRILV
jgi:hypothetical protein